MHIKTHERNDKTEYKCDVCDYRSYNHANVKRHTLTRHKNPHELKTYTCNSCDYVTVLEGKFCGLSIVYSNCNTLQNV